MKKPLASIMNEEFFNNTTPNQKVWTRKTKEEASKQPKRTRKQKDTHSNEGSD